MDEKKYTADSIQSLDGIEHVRLRPSMYIGDVGQGGLHQLIYEVIDNSIDESLAGYCNIINVTINEDNSVTVKDNGRGIPVDMHKKEGISALEVVMTKIGAGGKFNKDSYKVSGGLHGVGVSCVNALSIKLIATIYRHGKIYRQEYSKGKPLGEIKEIGKTNFVGTEISFLPDSSIFNQIFYNYNILSNRLRELSYLNKGLTICFRDERNKNKLEDIFTETFYSEGGLKEFVIFMDRNRDPVMDVIHIQSVNLDVSVEVAMRYNTSYIENIYSYVNNINTYEGGTHITGFRRALTRTFKKFFDEKNLGKEKNKIEVIGDDFREGLTAIISVKIMNPQFEGQTKHKLGNSEIVGVVDKVVGEMLSNFLEENPIQAKLIFEKILIAARARQAAKKAREIVQRKSVIGNGNRLPGKLADCSSNKVEECEIYLVEGDSAGGTAKQGRDRHFQAILPLRGKIINVEKAMTYKVFENEEIKNIYTALGVTIGTETDSKALNLSNLRYHKIIIMTDADVDGSHISTLILTFFFRYMKELIDNHYIYIATPPLFCLKKGNKQFYAWNEKEREKIISEISLDGKGVVVQRYKGLGEMNKEQLWETTMNPQFRTLRLITTENFIVADHVFSMLMGDAVPPRREFIENHAIYANINI